MPFRYYRRAKGFTLQEHSTRQITPRRWPEREKSPQLLPLRRQGGDQLLNFLTEAGAVQPFLAEAPPGFGERHETELMHPEDRRGGRRVSPGRCAQGRGKLPCVRVQ